MEVEPAALQYKGSASSHGVQALTLPTRPCARPAAERNIAAAHAAVEAMAADGVPRTRLHYSALLAVHSAAGDLVGTDVAYRSMQAAGFAADGRTFRLLFDAVKHWALLDGELSLLRCSSLPSQLWARARQRPASLADAAPPCPAAPFLLQPGAAR